MTGSREGEWRCAELLATYLDRLTRVAVPLDLGPHYLVAVQTLPPMARDHLLGMDVADAPWDDALAATMRDKGCAVAEEAIIEVLLDDLRATSAT
jgi:hypothetical protein